MYDLRALNTGPQIPTGFTPYPNFLAIYNAPTAGDEQLAENVNGPVPLTMLVSARLEYMSINPIN